MRRFLAYFIGELLFAPCSGDGGGAGGTTPPATRYPVRRPPFHRGACRRLAGVSASHPDPCSHRLPGDRHRDRRAVNHHVHRRGPYRRPYRCVRVHARGCSGRHDRRNRREAGGAPCAPVCERAPPTTTTVAPRTHSPPLRGTGTGVAASPGWAPTP